jgi:DNA-binding transcriptional regulator YiaG
MPNIAKVLKDEVQRLAKKVVTTETATMRKQAAQYRRDIAALKRQVDDMQRRLNFIEKQETKRVAAPAEPDAAENARFSRKGLVSHREKLGLSAADYGKLLGVTGQSVYSWEQGRTRPRPTQLAKIVEIRGIGKREALRRLEMLDEHTGSNGQPAA